MTRSQPGDGGAVGKEEQRMGKDGGRILIPFVRAVAGAIGI